MRSRYALIYLQEAIYYLPPHILLMGSEKYTLGKSIQALRNVVLGLQVFG